MKLFFKKLIPVLALMIVGTSTLYGAALENNEPSKQFDLHNYHNVGNIWLRVSNYGFFGSGNDADPQYPSLEYPGGSGADYLYQGALWFGAKKYRRTASGKKMYWKYANPTPTDEASCEFIDEDEYNQLAESGSYTGKGVVYDTLVTVGFDGDLGLYEFLPAYNPLENANDAIADHFNIYNSQDKILTASIRNQQRGFDDDGDGKIDEDFPGYTFPMRPTNELPEEFKSLGGIYLSEQDATGSGDIVKGIDKWFPLGFMDLAIDTDYFNFASEIDDDSDGRYDEDGAPVSEQDFIAYYYDYSPFGYEGERDWGRDKSRNSHYPLNIRVRQMSYQWSYEYIKNLVYIEFDITNMNAKDTLRDCAMGIYMDSDVGPQSYDSDKAQDDISGYQKGADYEFAFTRDDDGDGGLCDGLVGSRVCSPVPDPDSLLYNCWFWKVGQGPDDEDPRDLSKITQNKTVNQKYALLTGGYWNSSAGEYSNPDPAKWKSLRSDDPNIQFFEQEEAKDTRYLFAFTGARPQDTDYNTTGVNPETGETEYVNRWNLPPKATMKIVIAIFPGDDIDELKAQASWAKTIYGKPQTLTTVIKPDTETHYNPPKPPTIPALYLNFSPDGGNAQYFWDNRSEYSFDTDTVKGSEIGWQNTVPEYDSYYAKWDETAPNSTKTWSEIYDGILDGPENNIVDVSIAKVSPVTGYRLRHDFEGYRIWIRSGSGSQEDWSLINMWGREQSDLDLEDYDVNDGTPIYTDYGGFVEMDSGLPNKVDLSDPAIFDEYKNYYTVDRYYRLVPITEDSSVYGYNYIKYDVADSSVSEINVLQQSVNEYVLNTFGINTIMEGSNKTILPLDVKKDVAFNFYAIPYSELSNKIQMLLTESEYKKLFIEMFDDRLYPLYSFGGQSATLQEPGQTESDVNNKLSDLRKQRLARRFYNYSANIPRKGVETYFAVTAFDRGMPAQNLRMLETGRDSDANMKIYFPGPTSKGQNGDDVYVVPNPYVGRSSFDGRREGDDKGDKSKRIWFVNLPEKCTVKIYTLAGDLVKKFKHDGEHDEDIIAVSKAATQGIAASSIHSWDLLSKNNQIVAPGVYLFSVKNGDDVHVGKFVLIK